MAIRIVSVCAAMVVATFAAAQDSKFDEPPMPSKTVASDYPQEMKRAGIAGMVTLSITVEETGKVQNLVVRKSTRAEFEQPALDAIEKWKFEPAKKDGKPVAVHVGIPMKFSN